MRALLLVALCGCVRPPDAPEDLGDVARYLLRVHDDPLAAAAGLARLEALLASIDTTTDIEQRVWELPPLEDADVASLPRRPDRPLSGLVGAAVAIAVKGDLDCYARLQTVRDQTPIEATAKRYDRQMLSDPGCFVDGTCETLLTRADVLRSSIVLEAAFVQWKSFRWVTPHRTFYGRAWLEESAPASGKSRLWQGYGVDVYMARDDGVLRFFAVWNETDVYLGDALVDDATELATVAGATEGVLLAADRLCP